MLAFLLWCLLTVAGVGTMPTNDTTSEPLLLDPFRNSALTWVVNVSSAAALQEEANANVSSALSNTSLSDIENDNITQTLQLRYRERKKQERIIVIQAQILHRLRMSRQPNISASMFSEDEQKKIAMIVERMHHINNNNNVEYDSLPLRHRMQTTQRLQSFYPSCSLPNNTDKSCWEQPGTFRIFYDVPFNKHTLNSNVSIMLAKLRLFKITGNVDPNFVGWDSNQSTLPRYNLLENLINSRAANGINVAVYQYLKPLRLNKREKKRLLDSRTLALDHQGWVEFNVISALNHWLQHSKKNFGFDIEVEDAYGNKLNPNLYFQNMNCSVDVRQDPPFPNIMELHPEMGENESSLFDNETYPTLDLQTAEIPKDYPTYDILVDRMNERVISKRSYSSVCRKDEVYVTFAEMGLGDVIISPQGVQWTFCGGKCDPTINETSNEGKERYSYTSWIHRLLNFKRRSSSSTCIVSRTESLPIVYYNDENEVLETTLEDIVPKECACRSS